MKVFTVVLTKGAYVVTESDAERLLQAVEKAEPHVLVEADLLGDGIHFAPVRIVTAHIISVVLNSDSAELTARPRLSGIIGGR